MAVFGPFSDLVGTEPLSYWSEVSLVVWQDIPGGVWSRLWERVKEVRSGIPMEVIEADRAHGWRRAAIECELIES